MNNNAWIFITAVTTAVVAVAGERLYQHQRDLSRENRRLKSELRDEREARQKTE